MDISRRITESVVDRLAEDESAAAAAFNQILSDVRGSMNIEELGMEPDENFVGVASMTQDEAEEWLRKNGYTGFKPGTSARPGPTSRAWFNVDTGVMATIQPIPDFGSMVTVGFAELPTAGRKAPPKKAAPDAAEFDDDEFAGWEDMPDGAMGFPMDKGTVH